MVYRLIYAVIVVIFAAGIARAEAHEALAEVNHRRAQRGLPPFIFDAGLTAGAMNVAQFRADRLIVGHTANDMAGLPSGVHADAAGCAAWPPGLGWGSCCSEDAYTYAGAAWAMGRNGERFMHLFVRGPTSHGGFANAVPNVSRPVRPAPVRRRR